MTIMSFLLRTLGYVAFLPLLGTGGNAFCKFCLRNFSLSETHKHFGGGRSIGLFERLLISIGVMSFQWELIVAVIALKTVARHKNLDDQKDAEYFLIGSLASLFWAVLLSLGLILYDVNFGYDFFSYVRNFLQDIK